MPWWTGLPPETIHQLRDQNPGLKLEQIAIEAVRHPEHAEEFQRLGADVVSVPEVDHMGLPREPHEPAEEVRIPSGNADAFRDLVVAAMLADDVSAEITASPRRAGRAEEPIPERTLLETFRLIVVDHASARMIADITDHEPELSFVNRIKAGHIVRWATTHEAAVQRAVSRQEIPSDFPATSGGRLLPKL